ncbi:polysaccharide pyruvyl transferase family protein [Gordonia sp. CPCC 205515]|uniref:polysaccharide pyruvyl transferase family protein n=1 Tax=Gordonia sp. CPCC 205515 TaxID=3140791 RepID=UPI003AF35941
MQLPGSDVVSRVRDRLRRNEIIYLIAPSGHPNYGDELIARAWLRHLARSRPRALVVLDCHSPGQAALMLRDAHPDVVFVDTLWQLALYAATERDGDTLSEGPDPAAPWEWVARAATTFGPAPRLSEGIDVFRRASSVHLLGGGYVNKVWPEHVSLVVAVAELARTTGVPAYASGQGLIPLVDEPARTALLAAAAEFTVFDVRDAASAEALGSLAGRRQTGDDAWLAVPEVLRDLERTETPTPDGVTLCIQSDLTDDFAAFGTTGLDALTRFVGATLDAWEIPGSAVTVVEAIPGADLEVPTRLGDRLDGATRVPFLDIWRSGLPVGRGSTWISTRFHPHLIAGAAGDSGIGVIGRPDYYATKHQSLVDAGSRWTVVDDPDAIPARPHAGGFSADDREKAVAAKKALAQRLYPRRIK